MSRYQDFMKRVCESGKVEVNETKLPDTLTKKMESKAKSTAKSFLISALDDASDDIVANILRTIPLPNDVDKADMENYAYKVVSKIIKEYKAAMRAVKLSTK